MGYALGEAEALFSAPAPPSHALSPATGLAEGAADRAALS